ncbi:MAG TPA: hypothetical protein VFO83_04705, partial [Aggregicoccus sp.]|nr:hypothetical protein [Aggregicoccus sp.]
NPAAHAVTRARGQAVRAGVDPADFDLLLERRRRRHGADLRMVEFWELRASKRTGFSVVAAGSVSPELAQRAREAGFAPQIAQELQP